MAPDAANRLATVGGQTVTNDHAGRTLALPAPHAATMGFEGLDWLNSYTRAGQTTTYGYDGDGVRTQRAAPTGTTRYLTAPGGDMPTVMAECNDGNTPFRFHIYGATGLIASADASGGYVVPHFNHRGDTLALTRGNNLTTASVSVGAVMESYGYSSYGLTTGSNVNSTNPFRLIGQYGVMDESDGLHFMRARYYMANSGRFLSRDQLDKSGNDLQNLDKFTYAFNNPLSRIDPSGFDDMGCDVIWDLTPGQQSICALHDWLYQLYDCHQDSWTTLPITKKGFACQAANLVAVGFMFSPAIITGIPGIPQYYDDDTSSWYDAGHADALVPISTKLQATAIQQYHEVAKATQSIAKKTISTVKQTTKEIKKEMRSTAKVAKQSAKEMGKSMYSPAKQAAKEMSQSIYKPMKQTAFEMPKMMYSMAKQSATEMYHGITSAPKKAYNWLKKLW